MPTLQKSKSEAITVESSLMVTQNILMVLLSQLCFVRNIFPEEVFQQSKFGNCLIRAVQKGVNDEADRMIQWLEDGVFSLLQKGSLCMMVLGIYLKSSSPSEFVEAWYFRVGCGGELNVRRDRAGSSQSVLVGTTKEEVKDLSQQFVRTVISLGGCLEDLPMERYLTMRIVHEDLDGTSYRPPNFICAHENSQEFVRYATKPSTLYLGSIATPFNSVSLKLKTTIEDSEPSSSPQPSQSQIYIETDAEVEMGWRSNSDSDSESESTSSHKNGPERHRSMSVPPEILSDIEMNALYEISKCDVLDGIINQSTHPTIFQLSKPVLSKMVGMGALIVNSTARNRISFRINSQIASTIYQKQLARQRSPDIQMSQLSVTSPASSTVYVATPRFGSVQAGFAATVQRHRTFGAMPTGSSPISKMLNGPARLEQPQVGLDQPESTAPSLRGDSRTLNGQAQDRQERKSFDTVPVSGLPTVQKTSGYPGIANGGISKSTRPGRYGTRTSARKATGTY